MTGRVTEPHFPTELRTPCGPGADGSPPATTAPFVPSLSGWSGLSDPSACVVASKRDTSSRGGPLVRRRLGRQTPDTSTIKSSRPQTLRHGPINSIQLEPIELQPEKGGIMEGQKTQKITFDGSSCPAGLASSLSTDDLADRMDRLPRAHRMCL